MKKNIKKGFSLAEMMIVLLIISLVIAVGGPMLAKKETADYTALANIKKDIADLKTGLEDLKTTVNDLTTSTSEGFNNVQSEIDDLKNNSADSNIFVQSGANSGTTTYVYPPTGYTMSNLVAFICSTRTIYFYGDVDGNDSLYCYWQAEATRVAITCYNSEQRATPTVNWLAAWSK